MTLNCKIVLIIFCNEASECLCKVYRLKETVIVFINIPFSFCTTLWRSQCLPLGPLANNSIQSVSLSLLYILGHIGKGRERDSSSSRFSGLCGSVSVAEWTVPVFVPVPVSRCHPESRRHCFRIQHRRSGLLPHSIMLSFDLATRGEGGELGESGR